jgi:hypothetical protein
VTVLVGVAGITTAFICRNKSWRRIYVTLFRTGLLVVVFFIILFSHTQTDISFFNPQWIATQLSTDRDPYQWFKMLLLFSLTVIIWKISSAHVSAPLAPENVYRRFDNGVIAFLSLFIVKSLLAVKGQMSIPHPDLELFFFSYFIFGLFCVGSVRNLDNAKRDYMPGFGKIGVLLSFTVLVLTTGAFIFVLGYAALTTGADAVSQQMKTAAIPLLPWLKSILRFLFLPDAANRPNETRSPDGGEGEIASLAQAEKDIGIIGEIIKWLPAGLMLLMGIIVLAAVLWVLFRYLLLRVPIDKAKHDPGAVFGWLDWFKTVWRIIEGSFIILIKGFSSGMELFSALMAWGRHSGVLHRRMETPQEYGRRLTRSFPDLEEDINLIVALFHKECYAESKLNPTEMKTGRRALSRMRRIAILPRRLKAWFTSTNG